MSLHLCRACMTVNAPHRSVMAIFLLSFALLFVANAALVESTVDPSLTDPAITTRTALLGGSWPGCFLTRVPSAVGPGFGVHRVVYDSATPNASRYGLWVSLSGSGGKPVNTQQKQRVAASQGYHAIGRAYANPVPVGTLCAGKPAACQVRVWVKAFVRIVEFASHPPTTHTRSIRAPRPFWEFISLRVR